MRTDTPHIKYTSGFYTYLNIFFIYNFIFTYLEKFPKNLPTLKNKYVRNDEYYDQ